MTEALFHSYRLPDTLRTTSEKVRNRIANWEIDAFLKASEHDLIETLVSEGTVDCPRLLRDQAWMLDIAETDEEHRSFGETVVRGVPMLTLVVPFTGEAEVFWCQPSVWTSVLPRVASLGTTELRVTVAGNFTDAAQAQIQFERELDLIDTYLEWCRQDIDQHNEGLRSAVSGWVSARRQQLLAMRNLQAEIGFPIRRRPDADTYSVPVTRKTIAPRRPPASGNEPFAPEPVLAETDYEAALEILDAQRNALERTPSVAAGMDEESIRDLLLINLNAQFKGTAAGEVFNGAGKTDILVRERDRNVFIGECKVWKGPKTVRDALTQLFGYLVWRDTKAALLVFIRTKNVSVTVKTAIEQIEAHPNYKRRGTHDTDGRIDFVMHANGDPDREIKLAFLPFALPSDAVSRFAKAETTD
ncbi:hypothetical protein [Streptosporangium saharense]|uniref:Uncharacterized protein n=1 Tax=Streptosporangium saharense TaxID=1706840 RepID=A0A7W7QNS9_9ACTN|nr:hypothetical protein [Streptosporangium saharense]MBB4916883.1 hypothetical protein [Streptosporangium saharense]